MAAWHWERGFFGIKLLIGSALNATKGTAS